MGGKDGVYFCLFVLFDGWCEQHDVCALPACFAVLYTPTRQSISFQSFTIPTCSSASSSRLHGSFLMLGSSYCFCFKEIRLDQDQPHLLTLAALPLRHQSSDHPLLLLLPLPPTTPPTPTHLVVPALPALLPAPPAEARADDAPLLRAQLSDGLPWGICLSWKISKAWRRRFVWVGGKEGVASSGRARQGQPRTLGRDTRTHACT